MTCLHPQDRGVTVGLMRMKMKDLPQEDDPSCLVTLRINAEETWT